MTSNPDLAELDLQRYDADGKPCSLDTLCRRDPEWAASRIRALERENGELSGALRSVVESAERGQLEGAQTWDDWAAGVLKSITAIPMHVLGKALDPDR
jgi:hypothetical protein